MKQYYFPYFPGLKKYNYLPLLCFWISGEYNKNTKLYDTITFQNLDDLLKKVETAISPDLRLFLNLNYPRH